MTQHLDHIALMELADFALGTLRILQAHQNVGGCSRPLTVDDVTFAHRDQAFDDIVEMARDLLTVDNTGLLEIAATGETHTI